LFAGLVDQISDLRFEILLFVEEFGHLLVHGSAAVGLVEIAFPLGDRFTVLELVVGFELLDYVVELPLDFLEAFLNLRGVRRRIGAPVVVLVALVAEDRYAALGFGE